MVRPADERHVGAHTDRRHPPLEARDAPHPFRPFAPDHVDVVDEHPLDLVGGQLRGRVADVDRAGRGHRLQSSRHVDDVAHRRVLSGAGDGADHHLARVHPDAQVQRPVDVDLGVNEPVEGLVQLERGPDRPIGVVLVRDGGAEERQDRIAQHLVDRAAEGFDVDDQALEGGVDEPFQPFRVEMLREARIAHDVGEQDGHDAPFLGRRGDDLVATIGAEARTIGQRP